MPCDLRPVCVLAPRQLGVRKHRVAVHPQFGLERISCVPAIVAALAQIDGRPRHAGGRLVGQADAALVDALPEGADPAAYRGAALGRHFALGLFTGHAVQEGLP